MTPKSPSEDKVYREILHNQLIKLGDMMSDGLHLEEGGSWISREYKSVCRKLYPEFFPKKDFTNRNKAVKDFCDRHSCEHCEGGLKQTRSGSLRVICTQCGQKYQLKRRHTI